jgi:hypothetical protein
MKKLGIILGVMVLLGGGAAVAVRVLLPEEKVRSMAIVYAEKATGRKVSLGELKLGLVFGVRLKDVSVEGLASARQITLRPSWRALLERKVEIQSVSVDGLRLKLPKDASQNKAPGKALSPSQAAAGAAVSVRKLSVTDAEIVGDGFTLKELKATVTGASSDKPFPASVSFLAVTPKLTRRLSFDGTVDPSKRAVDGKADVEGLMSGAVKGGADAVDFDVKIPALSVEQLAALGVAAPLASPAFSAKGRAENLQARPRLARLRVDSDWGSLEGKGDLERAEARLDLSLPALKLSGYELPSAKISGGVAGNMVKAELSGLRVKTGGTDLEVSGTASKTALDLMLKCRSFVLEELLPIAPQTRALKLTGKGLFAFGVKGAPEKPVLAGKAQFSNLGGEALGMAVSGFTGTATFDERRLDVPNLKGTLDGSVLRMDLTVKDYSKAPAIDLVAELDKLDLGKLLAASAQAGAEKLGEAGTAKPASSPQALKAKGKVTIKEVVHPNIRATNARLSWDLTGITPNLSELGGTTRVDIGEGQLKNLKELAEQHRMIKAALTPILVVQKISKIFGGKFPDLNDVAYDQIAGDYAFSRGVMTVKESRLRGSDASASSTGTVNLVSEALDLDGRASVKGLPDAEFSVKGTISEPKPRLKLEKLIEQPVKKLLEDPAKALKDPAKLIEGLFRR